MAAKEATATYKPEPDVLHKQLTFQTQSFIDRLKEQKIEGFSRFSPEKLQFLNTFFGHFTETRNRRADEIDSPEYTEALDWINGLFPYSTFTVDCIDGRVLSVLIAGFIAKFGGTLRLPAAQPKEFLIDEKGEPVLRTDSNFALRLQDIFKKQDQENAGDDTVVQVLDSHLGCKARQDISPGHKDNGLWVDVKQKKRMAKAMINHVAEKYPHKRILPIQISFDPSDGSLYMGLERNKVFEEHSGDEAFFNDPEKTNLLSLATNDQILSSKTLAWQLSAQQDDPNPMSKPFNQFEFYPPLDWRNNYVDSARQFWAYMTQMVNHGVLEEYIIPRIQKIYGEEYKNMDANEAHTRAVILLASAFSYYLHNRNEQGIVPRPYSKNYYPYDVHKERCVTVGEGGYAPFPAASNDESGQVMDSFAVYSKDADSLIPNVMTAVSIVQSNRRGNRISDDIKMPVPVIVQELVRAELNEGQWRRLERSDFSDLPETWVKWNRESLDDYLTRKEGIRSHSPIIDVVWKLMMKMQILYSPRSDLAQSLTDGDIAIFPMIVDQDRRARKVIPFMLNGFAVR